MNNEFRKLSFHSPYRLVGARVLQLVSKFHFKYQIPLQYSNQEKNTIYEEGGFFCFLLFPMNTCFRNLNTKLSEFFIQIICTQPNVQSNGTWMLFQNTLNENAVHISFFFFFHSSLQLVIYSGRSLSWECSHPFSMILVESNRECDFNYSFDLNLHRYMILIVGQVVECNAHRVLQVNRKSPEQLPWGLTPALREYMLSRYKYERNNNNKKRKKSSTETIIQMLNSVSTVIPSTVLIENSH